MKKVLRRSNLKKKTRPPTSQWEPCQKLRTEDQFKAEVSGQISSLSEVVNICWDVVKAHFFQLSQLEAHSNQKMD